MLGAQLGPLSGRAVSLAAGPPLQAPSCYKERALSKKKVLTYRAEELSLASDHRL